MEKMELLEEKIRRAAEMIRSLRDERNILEEQLKSARDEVKRLALRKPEPETNGRLEKLQKERQLIAERVEKMIAIMEEVDAT